MIKQVTGARLQYIGRLIYCFIYLYKVLTYFMIAFTIVLVNKNKQINKQQVGDGVNERISN